MGTVDLDYLKQGFASLVQQAERTTLPTFILWLDLKVAEFKVNGFMILDESRSGEGWLELIQRCRNQAPGTYTGYHVHANNAFIHHGPGNGPNDQLHGGQNTEHMHPLRGAESNERMHSYRPGMPEHSENARQTGSPRQMVQIKPEPADLGFEKLQQDIRNERSQQRWYSGVLRRSMEYPIPHEGPLPPMEMAHRDKALPLPLDYPGHPDRSMITQNHENHEPMQTGYSISDENRSREITPPERIGGLDLNGRDREQEGLPLPTSESGFFKMTTSSSGIPLVSRQTTNRCPICNRIFHYYSSFNRHMKLHQGIFTHVCEVCRRKFTRKEHFVRHKCHRRPNKPSRMADPFEGDNSVGSSGEPLVQPPPTNNKLSPKEAAAPPPLIHVTDIPTTPLGGLLSQRNPFTYDSLSYTESLNVPISSTINSQSAHTSAENDRPSVSSEVSTNSKHRRKTTTPMKVEAFMEPPPSLDHPGEMNLDRSMEDNSDSIDKSFRRSPSTESPIVNYRRASSSDINKVSSAAGEFSNISRPQSRNSEPAQSSHNHWGFDLTMETENKSPKENATSLSGPLRDDQYPILKRKVLEAASSLQSLENSLSNGNSKDGDEEEKKEDEKESNGRDSSDGQVFIDQAQGNGGVAYNNDVSNSETQPTDLSATGTPTGPLSRGSSSPSRPNSASTTEAETPTGLASTPQSSNDAPTPSSAPAMSPHGNQLGEGQTPQDTPLEPHTPNKSPGKEGSLCLNSSLCMSSAYATSEPSPPSSSAKQQQPQQQGDIHCPSCSRKFLHLSSLNRHMKLHQGIFTHACALCSRKFTRKEHFVNHKCSRRPRNPTRVMAPMEPDSLGQPQRVEYPPSLTLSRQPSPPGSSTWDAGSLSMSSGGGLASPIGSPLASPLASPSQNSLIPQPGSSILNENSSPSYNSTSPENRRMWKWKSKWQQ